MQVGRVANHRHVSCIQGNLQLYAGGKRCREELESLVHHGLHVDHDLVAESAAAETQDAFHQKLGTLGGVHDIVEISTQIAVVRGVLLREFSVTQDRTQN